MWRLKNLKIIELSNSFFFSPLKKKFQKSKEKKAQVVTAEQIKKLLSSDIFSFLFYFP